MAMNKTDLINAVAGETGMSKVDTEKAIKATIDSISKELAVGGSITLVGFGTFTIMERKARMGKNPRTGESIKIPAKKVAKFKPGKALSEMVSVKKEEKPAKGKKK
eukprot:TRINITY_DN18545_c0_g1_i1.p1 TRINITY_DN18545_c0_g1~~TRINITY_DN18545_c0_g1_i1.p1  ORF type:complete len:106 (-),score=4.15 TRINITY_DN18545_c0_g1_i1:27-344(-)